MRRTPLLALVCLLVLLVGLPPATCAEEEDAGTPWYLDLLRPDDALARLHDVLRGVDRRQQRTVQQRMANEYLDAWAAAELEPEDEEVDALTSLEMYALRYADALARQLPRVRDADREPKQRANAAARVATLLRNYSIASALEDDAEAEAAAALEALLPVLDGEDHASTRGTVHSALAAYAGRQDDDEAQIHHLMLAAEAQPATAGGAGRTIVRLLQGGSHEMEGYEALRERAAELLPRLRELAARNLEAKKAENDERALRVAESAVKLLETVDRPLTMLGEPAEAWTLEHAFGDVKQLSDLKGKVVVLDFWATWCPWCIRSFPALRELLTDYADQDLAVVGVTASASAIYEHRYDLDDDLKEKAGPGYQPQAAARLARDGQRKDGTPPSLPEAEYRGVEQEALARFVENHGMTWPVVMIDKAEPGPKYALTGWPHAVVLDREGRVRYFKSGALLKDRPEAVAAFRQVLDDLLAEASPPAGE